MTEWRVCDWFLWLVDILSGLGSASRVVVGLMVLPCSSRGITVCGQVVWSGLRAQAEGWGRGSLSWSWWAGPWLRGQLCGGW